jgi:hypothetical protein
MYSSLKVEFISRDYETVKIISYLKILNFLDENNYMISLLNGKQQFSTTDDHAENNFFPL